MASSALVVISMGLCVYSMLLSARAREEAANEDDFISDVEPDSIDGDDFLDSSHPTES